MYTLIAFGHTSFDISGPNPFLDQDTRNSAAYNTTVLTLRTDTVSTEVRVSDDDPRFHDVRFEHAGPQTLAQDVTLGGVTHAAGQSIAAEYLYNIRPVGSTSTTDNIEIVVFRIGGAIAGIAARAPLVPGQSYQVVSGGADHPDRRYSDLQHHVAAPICFTPGTCIDTLAGPVPMGTLRVGDLVLTRDSGAKPVLWIGGGPCVGLGSRTPVLVRAGRLGNRRDIVLSPNHRVLVGRGAEEGLVAVKALVDGEGIVSLPCPKVVYLHLLLEGHHVVSAEGAAVESLWPGPEALASLALADRDELSVAAGGIDPHGAAWHPARPLLRPGAWRRAQGLPRLSA